MAYTNSARGSKPGLGHFKDKTNKKKPAVEAVASPVVQHGEHGRYQIKSGWLSGTFVARAFPRPPTQARGMIAEATGATEEEAIATLQEAIDARENRRADNRREDSRAGFAVPSTEEYVEAIRHVALSRQQLAMLTAMSLTEGNGLTAERMAYAAGYKSQAAAFRSFAATGNLIGAYLSICTISNKTSSDPEGAALLGYRTETLDADDPGNWVLHEELQKAVQLAL